MNRSQFLKVCAQALRSRGFRRWDNFFYLNLRNGIVMLVWIHRSFFENSYYIEYAFSFDKLSHHIPTTDYYKAHMRCGKMRFNSPSSNEVFYSEVIPENFIENLKKNLDEIIAVAHMGEKALVDTYVRVEPVSKAILSNRKVAKYLGVDDLPNIRIANEKQNG